MERDDNVIELGAASVATHGMGALPGDEFIGQKHAGLSDD